MIKYCLHIIKGGSCRNGIATVFELFVSNSKISKHIVLSILPINYPCNLPENLETHTLLSFKVYRLYSLVRKLSKLSDSNELVVKTWGHASAFLSKFCRLFFSAPIVWGIHDSGPGNQRVVNLLVRLNRKDSYSLPSSIICVSRATLDKYKNNFGYNPTKLVYIANSLDTSKFRPDPENFNLRKFLGISESAPVIGLVSRYCLEKGVNIFIEAMQLISDKIPDARFVFCGFRMDVRNKKLVKKLKLHQISDRSLLLGQRSDMPAVYNLLDILVLPSYFLEAQSCCLIEAMSCGVMCVSTNIGDSQIILGNVGKLVQNNNPQIISETCLSLLAQNEQEKNNLKKEGREWIVKSFDLRTFIDKYDLILEKSNQLN